MRTFWCRRELLGVFASLFLSFTQRAAVQRFRSSGFPFSFLFRNRMSSTGGNAVYLRFKDPILGAEAARTITIALFAWMIYEYLITFDDEQEHFWKGSFSVSRALFFFNRYFPPCIIIASIASRQTGTHFLSQPHLFPVYSIKNPSADVCRSLIQSLFLLDLLGITVIQAILITRIWFLCPGERVVQFTLTFAFLVSLFTSLLFLSISMHELHVIVGFSESAGCHASRPSGFWRIYLPSLILHTGLYIMTIRQAITNTRVSKQMNLRSRLLADGGILYFVVLCSIGLTSIGSLLKEIPQINIPAIYSPIVLSTTSVATTRIMFSLRDMFTSEVTNLEWIPSTPSSLPLSMPKSPPRVKSFRANKNATLIREDSKSRLNKSYTPIWINYHRDKMHYGHHSQTGVYVAKDMFHGLEDAEKGGHRL
ncbi:hypothetical protein GALMADRAFT_150202 [Galerina marginata CBS 339.88]|uniref:DUF6533 domain-containing protein n=1 Tax=Galerina marginata (strain CBS 339.88) TaxID=685588 RepID=A0A067TU00_GALM3|nr:hypothetical protein GALMADRAFT_150202 [Galerina marginata CBS 339.88]